MTRDEKRPTASRDLSDGASAASLLPEATLVYGYRNMRRARHPVCTPCACGVDICAYAQDDLSVIAAVREHHRTSEHVVWRKRNGL